MPYNDDVIHVINRTALLENLLNQVIENYCSPRKDRFVFFWTVILDTSIMPMASKIKVAMAISQKLDFDLKQNPLHDLLSYRNAFAHHATDAHPMLMVGRTADEERSQFELHIISSSGKIKRLSRESALAEFDHCYKEAKESLLGLRNAVTRSMEGETKDAT
ncbi:MAG: hypothetical protein A2Z16_12790 [Chloroflexi bacterium RBG_16_54_18]|nr:MAG: hypothetical protein A2Z16_12790 [Chloroflexi bacterium RBG_16_54_18]